MKRQQKGYMIPLNQSIDDVWDIFTGRIDGNLNIIEYRYFKFSDGHIEKADADRAKTLASVPDVHECDEEGNVL